VITKSGNDLLALISDILDESRLESGAFKFEEVDLSLRTVAESALRSMAPVAQAKGLQILITTSLDQDPPPLRGDPFRIGQVCTCRHAAEHRCSTTS
jgi:signal transduction histidine kinase